MLILTRKPGQSLIISVPGHDPVEVLVTSTSKGSVKLGIDADKAINVVRAELLPKTQPQEEAV
jgi:carbon storage regulator CsrA|tara:strand:- start:422 stop:610 length:189 start_codon:yes stop_codon:yes gene_type:complete